MSRRQAVSTVAVDVEVQGLPRRDGDDGPHGQYGERAPGPVWSLGAQVEDERAGGQGIGKTPRIAGYGCLRGTAREGGQGAAATGDPVGQQAGVRAAERVGAGQGQMPGDPALTTAGEEQVEGASGVIGLLDAYSQPQGVRQSSGQAGRA